ncbi:MAG: hypothetical protein SNJ77_01600 [Cytophagales bacterium]
MMKKAGLLISTISIALMAILLGCKKYPDFVGTPYRGASENFRVDTDLKVFQKGVTTNTVNFTTNGAAYFEATFSEKVNWYLNITSPDNGASITFTGVTNRIDSNVVKWYGGHDSEKFFRPGTKAIATLSFLNSKIVTRDTFNIASFANFPKTLTVFDFDNTVPTAQILNFAGTGQDFLGTVVNDPAFANHGLNYLRMTGTDLTNGFYIGGYRRTWPNTGALTQFYARTFNLTPLSSDTIKPEDLYVNMLIYSFFDEPGFGSGGQTNQDLCKINITFNEDDNKNGSHTPQNEDGFTMQIPVNWRRGWRLVSFPYSSFARETNVNFGGNGNNKKETYKIKEITVGLLSAPSGGRVTAAVDYLVFSYKQPLNLKQ